jgi:hypothetical protein
MVGHYATKSIVVIDFIDVKDLAIAVPSSQGFECYLKRAVYRFYQAVQGSANSEDVHGIAVAVGNFAATASSYAAT